MYDVLIIGAGPAGLAVAIEAEKNNLSHIIIDKGAVVNSLVNFPKDMTFFSTSELLEIGGIPLTSNDIRPTRREMIIYYQKVINFYHLNIRTYEKCVRLEGE
ncbi:MAG: NAD(P)-binding domain-containing protein, partial [Calditrichaceae bacterium]